jgi:membrane protein YdbS with pleckstrin-like domain
MNDDAEKQSMPPSDHDLLMQSASQPAADALDPRQHTHSGESIDARLTAPTYQEVSPNADSRISSISEAALDGYHLVSPQQITLSRISGSIVLAVISIGLVVILSMITFANWPPTTWLYGLYAGAVLIILTIAWMVIYLPRWSHNATGWRLDSQDLKIRTGIFWRKVVSVPRSRVQHADVQQGPLARSFRVATLVVHTAGTQNASVPLEGLSHGIAEQIRDELIRDDRQLNGDVIETANDADQSNNGATDDSF